MEEIKTDLLKMLVLVKKVLNTKQNLFIEDTSYTDSPYTL